MQHRLAQSACALDMEVLHPIHLLGPGAILYNLSFSFAYIHFLVFAFLGHQTTVIGNSFCNQLQKTKTSNTFGRRCGPPWTTLLDIDSRSELCPGLTMCLGIRWQSGQKKKLFWK